MIVTITTPERSIAVEEKTCVNIFDAMELMKSALLAVGYQPDSIKDGFYAMVEEYGDSEETKGCGGNCNCSGSYGIPDDGEIEIECSDCNMKFFSTDIIDDDICPVCKELK